MMGPHPSQESESRPDGTTISQSTQERFAFCESMGCGLRNRLILRSKSCPSIAPKMETSSLSAWVDLRPSSFLSNVGRSNSIVLRCEVRASPASTNRPVRRVGARKHAARAQWSSAGHNSVGGICSTRARQSRRVNPRDHLVPASSHTPDHRPATTSNESVPAPTFSPRTSWVTITASRNSGTSWRRRSRRDV